MKVSIGDFPKNPCKRKRLIKVHIDPWDVYNCDCTLALIIKPLIVRLKEMDAGRPGGLEGEEWCGILDKIIWSMDQIIDEAALLPEDKEYYERVQEGCELLGKWFQGLWY